MSEGNLMEISTKISYEDLTNLQTYKDYIQQFGNRARRKNAILCIGLIIIYFLITYLRIGKYLVLINVCGVALTIYILCIFIFYSNFLRSVNKKNYRRSKISGDMEMKFLDKYIYLTGDSTKLRLVPAYQKIKKEKVKDIFILYVLETEDTFYFLRTNVCFFVFMKKTDLKKDEIQKLKTDLKSIYGNKYISLLNNSH